MLQQVQPSVRREGFTTTPDVTWDDVGALAEVGADGQQSWYRMPMNAVECSVTFLTPHVFRSARSCRSP